MTFTRLSVGAQKENKKKKQKNTEIFSIKI